MLKKAGISVAMGNADDNTKKRCTYISLMNDEHWGIPCNFPIPVFILVSKLWRSGVNTKEESLVDCSQLSSLLCVIRQVIRGFQAPMDSHNSKKTRMAGDSHLSRW
jgi:hypothetical protein